MRNYQTSRVCAQLHQSTAAIPVITPTETARLSSIVFTKMLSVATNVSSISTVLALTLNARSSLTWLASVSATVMVELIGLPNGVNFSKD
jgi:hypothetical protein